MKKKIILGSVTKYVNIHITDNYERSQNNLIIYNHNINYKLFCMFKPYYNQHLLIQYSRNNLFFTKAMRIIRSNKNFHSATSLMKRTLLRQEFISSAGSRWLSCDKGTSICV